MNNPFSQKKSKTTKDFQNFIKDKYNKERLTSDKEIQLEEDISHKLNKQNIVTRLVKKFLNPLELNERLRKSFNLGDDYKLIYLNENERLQLIVNGVALMLMPLCLWATLTIFLAELTGHSKLNEYFENTYIFLTSMILYGGIILMVAIHNQRTTILRIYFNETTNKYVSVKVSGLLKFKKEEFLSEMCTYRYDPSLQKKKNAFIEIMTKYYGNIYINGKLQRLDFKSFSSHASIKKLFGARIVEVLKAQKAL